MALAGFDRVRATSLTTGTGALTLVPVTGFRTFGSEFTAGELIPYVIEGRNNDHTADLTYEYGIGSLDGLGNLVRTSPTFSTSGMGIAHNFTSNYLVIACGFTQKGVELLIEYSPLFIRNKQMVDATNYYVDATDNTKRARLESQLISTGTDRTYSFPDASGIFVLNDNVATLTNKTIDCDNNTVLDIRNANVAEGAAIDVDKLQALTPDRVVFTDANGFLTTGTITTQDILDAASTSFADNVFEVYDDITPSKKVMFQCSGITAATTRTLTIPNANGTIVLNDNAATLTNKTIDAGSNTITNLVNANIAAGAAIDWSKMANQTADRFAIINASGDVSTVSTMVYEAASGTTIFGGAATVSTSRFTVNAIASGNAAIFRNSTGASQIMRLQDDLNVVLPAVTASRALATGASSQIVASATTATELGHLSGVSSNVQTQLNGKLDDTATADKMIVTSAAGAITTASLLNVNQANSLLGIGVAVSTTNRVLINGQTADATTNALNVRDSLSNGIFRIENTGLIFTPRLTSSRALATGASSQLVVANTTLAELNFVNGVTSAIQTQLNGKLNNTASPVNKAMYVRSDGVIAPNSNINMFASSVPMEIVGFGTGSTTSNLQLRTSASAIAIDHTDGGSIGLGTVLAGTTGTRHIHIQKGTIPSTPIASGANIYTQDRAGATGIAVTAFRSEDNFISYAGFEPMGIFTTDANITCDCRSYMAILWRFTPTASRTVFLDNLDVGRTIRVRIITLGAVSAGITIQARSLSASSYVNVNLSGTFTGAPNGLTTKPNHNAYLEITCFARDLYFYGFGLNN